jgi:hypothetical protein
MPYAPSGSNRNRGTIRRITYILRAIYSTILIILNFMALNLRGPNIFINAPYSYPFSLYLVTAKDQVSYPYKTAVEIINLYVSVNSELYGARRRER